MASREEAEQLLDEWDGHEDGPSLPEFCARSLHCWAMNLGRVARERPAPELALVELAVRAPSRANATYRVVVGELAVEIDDAFHEDTLLRLLRVVARC